MVHDNQRLEKERHRLEEENKRLRKELETAQRAARRQAAPFSRRKAKSQPKRPGRKSGAAQGPHRQRPIPNEVEEEIHVWAPAQCPAGGGPLRVERVESQYQEAIVRRTWVRRFHVPVCRCAQCNRRARTSRAANFRCALSGGSTSRGGGGDLRGVDKQVSGLPHADASLSPVMQSSCWGRRSITSRTPIFAASVSSADAGICQGADGIN